MAAYDLPASLAHALARSNASALAYVGHSQGTTLAFAALASQPALAAQARALACSGTQLELQAGPDMAVHYSSHARAPIAAHARARGG